ncbi:MAG TPA: isocitrate/isopropylmalate family dehydrogenase [Actinomycetota bacterium]|nr:isocitrate/isopropylmalate family dehydrogenase [Actinomycetota bacterium]
MTTAKTVVVIPGDGIGPEIWAATRPVLDAALQHTSGTTVVWDEWPAGERGLEESGDPLPRTTLEAIGRHRVALKGPLTTPVGSGFRSINVALRLHFDLYANIRPVRWLPGIATPVRHPERINAVLFRENTEDVYSGYELEPGTPELLALAAFCRERFRWPIPADAGVGLKPISESASKRLVRAALRFAVREKRRSVTLVHKGNIQKFTEGRFRAWGYEVAVEEFADTSRIEAVDVGPDDGRVIVRDLLADAFLQEILINPERIDVIATTNLNGDYMSEALAAQVGGIGVAPGGNVNEEAGRGIFEPAHGTAPTLAGQDAANPIALMLSGAMLFDFLGWRDAGDAVRSAVHDVVDSGVGTPDLGLAEHLGTKAFGDRVTAAVGSA